LDQYGDLHQMLSSDPQLTQFLLSLRRCQ
jgi:hypothetical protein